MLDAFLTVLQVTQSIAVAVLIWRSMVADRERGELVHQLSVTEEWIRTLVMELLNRTDIKERGG